MRKPNTSINTKSNKTMIETVIVLFCSILIITLCSTSSPIYPINFAYDTNAYFTIGKSLVRGLVPYKDVFDHKGPFLYLIYAIAALISFKNFIGVYIIEIINCFFFLFLSLKTFKLYSNKSLYLIPFEGFLVYSSMAFDRGGSAEEFCLPFLAFAIYVFIKTIRNNELPDFKDSLLIGITSGCIIWIKFNFFALYIGFLIPYALLSYKKKCFQKLIKTIFSMCLGILISTIPYFIYFGINSAIKDWFEVYIYSNILGYPSTEKSSIVNILSGFGYILSFNTATSLLAIAGLYWCFKQKNNYLFTGLLSSLLFLILATYGGGRNYVYYSFTFSVFSIIGCLFYNKFREDKKHLASLISIVVIAITVLLVGSKFIIGLGYTSKNQWPQYQIAKEIKDSGIDNPSVINYGMLDSGVLATTGLVPQVRYFYCPNFDQDNINEIQEDYMKDGKIDFVISDKPQQQFENFVLIGTYEGIDSLNRDTYYLYKHETKPV